MEAVFTNDNHIRILVPDHPKTATFVNRDKNEVMLRRISTFLINNKFITRNIIDLGAWIGDNAVPWAKNINGTVYAIDPSENNCNFMKIVCGINNITNVDIFQLAISDKEELLSTSHHIDHCSFLESGSTVIKSTTLDILHQQGKIKDVDYVHLDVEGMEFRVLKGMTNIIDTYHPIIAYEQHIEIDNLLEIIQFLKPKNYIIFMINEVLPDCRPDCRNFIAFPNTPEFEKLVKYLVSYFGISNLFTRF